MLNEPSDVEERTRLVVSELKNLLPDVLMLQEVLDIEFNAARYIADELGYSGIQYGDFVTHSFNKEQYGCVTLSRKPFDDFAVLHEPAEGINIVPSVATIFTLNGVKWSFINNHFAWGSRAEHRRLTQAKMNTEYARARKSESLDSVIVMAGDLNAVPEASSIRYLDGLDTFDSDSDLWVDAWKTCGLPSNEMTTRNDNYLAHRTARGVGISYPEMIPERRIDYIKVYGWAYGRNGCPINFGRWGDSISQKDIHASDHYGIYADLLVLD